MLHELGEFDALFFDTYAESYKDLRSLMPHLKNVLRSQGIRPLEISSTIVVI